MSEASSRASAASTSDSNEPECTSPGNAKPTPIDAACSPTDSPESTAPTMFVHSGGITYNEVDEIGSLTQQSASESSWMVPLILSAEASPAKTSLSPDAVPVSTAPAAASSSSMPESLTLFSPLADGSSLRTFPDYFPPTVAGIMPLYSRRWPSSGFTISPGECWTADTSESPNAGVVSTSLRDVLEATVPAKYYLSQRAAQGILRRAEKRGRMLPSHLSAALEAVARTTTTDKQAAS